MTPEGVNIEHPDKLFIGGEWVHPIANDVIEVVNPASEEVVARVAHAWTPPWPPRAMPSTTARGPPRRRWSAWPS